MPLIETDSATQAFIDPVIEAVTVMFDSMFGSGVRQTAINSTQSDTLYETTSLIGLAGDYSGSFCISAPNETLFAIVKRALDLDRTEVDRLCRDSLNELANVIAGYAKDRLIEDDIKLGLPTAVQGCGVAINYPQAAEPIRIDFESDMGRLMVVIGLVRRPKGDSQ